MEQQPENQPESKHPHDEHGHFIRKEPQVSGLLRSAVVSDETAPLVDVKVNNPFVSFFNLLKQIKNHQSTTVSLRFTIPLIALPIVLLAAFQLGRVQTTCSPVFSSQVGRIHILTIQVPKTESSWYSPFTNLLPGNFVPQKATGFTHENRAILLLSDGTTLSLIPIPGINLTDLNNMPVIVSGNYSACNKAITIDAPTNIQYLP